MVAAALLFGHLIQIQTVFELGHGDVTVEQPAAVLALHGPRGLGVARLEFAGDGFDQVLQGDDALHLAVLVDHKRHVHVGQTEVVQELHAGDGLGHVKRALQHLIAQLLCRVFQGTGQPLAGVDHAHDVLDTPLHHREAGVVGLFDAVEVVGKRIVHVQKHDVGARHHERANLAVVQAEHVAHHGVLVRLDHTGRGAFDQHGVDLFFGDRRAFGFFHPHGAQQTACGGRQEPHKGLGRHSQHVDGSGHQTGKGFGVGLADALGHQLADHDREIGDGQHHKAGGGVARQGLRHAHRNQPHRQRARQSRFTHDTVEHADGGDADLDRRQKTGGVFAQFDSGGSTAVALIDEFLQPGLAGGDQGNLGHGKQAIETDEGKQYRYFHTAGPAGP